MLQPKVVLFENEWPKIRPVVLKLLNQQSVSKQEWQDLFWTVYDLHSWAEKLTASIKDALAREISLFIQGAKQRILAHHESHSLLKAYVTEWQKFYDQSLYLYEPFRSIDGSSSNSSANVGSNPPLSGRRGSPLTQAKSTATHSSAPARKFPDDNNIVRKLMLDSWNQQIFSQIKDHLQQAAMQLVFAERIGESFDSQLVIGVRESCVSLCNDVTDRLAIYRANFEKAYLNAAEQFYKGRASNLLHNEGIQNYMRYAEQKLFEEEQRGRRYLDMSPESNSLQLVLDRCVETLVTAFQEQILAECPMLIKNAEVERLKLMFRLMNRTPTGVSIMLNNLEKFIKMQGVADMAANASSIVTDPEKYVDQLLRMFSSFSDLVKNAFYDDPRFLTSRDKAFQEVVNDTSVFKLEILPSSGEQAKHAKNLKFPTAVESRCPELLANYCDLLLRKSQLSKKMTSEDVDLKLRDLLLVLKYVQNKDVFMRFHKTHLMRRLISDTSMDQEKEEQMINRLRDAGMPADYVNKFFRMLQDMEVNKDLNRAFKASLSQTSGSSRSGICDVTIKILNAEAWMPRSFSEKRSLSVPRDLEDFLPEIELFYKTQHSGRCLRWQHHWSSGVLVFRNRVGTFELELTMFQMVVLLCWNDDKTDGDLLKLSFENLRLLTDIDDVELRKTLWTLVAAPKIKRQVLLCDFDNLVKTPRDIADNTLFWPNEDFALFKSNKLQTRGKLTLVGRLALADGFGKDRSTGIVEHDDILQLRILRVQEAIVKIMKTRKRVSSADLQAQIVDMLKTIFVPTRKLVKEQIEWLLDNKFIVRDDTDLNYFKYVA